MVLSVGLQMAGRGIGNTFVLYLERGFQGASADDT